MVSSLSIMQVEPLGATLNKQEIRVCTLIRVHIYKSVGELLQSPIFQVNDSGPHLVGCSGVPEEVNPVAYSDLNNVTLFELFFLP